MRGADHRGLVDHHDVAVGERVVAVELAKQPVEGAGGDAGVGLELFGGTGREAGAADA